MKIIASSPCRISLIGGGTDVPPFCWDHGGAVINLAINKRTIVKINNGKLSFSKGGGAGLGASGSLLVSLIGAYKKYGKLKVGRQEIAEEAFDIEVNQWGHHGGWQDEFAAVYGGLNFITSNSKKEFVVKKLPKNLVKGFLPWMVLFDTGIRRESGGIQDGFKKTSEEQLEALKLLKRVAIKAYKLFYRKAYRDLGRMLDLTWKLKKQSNDVTNDQLDNIYHFGKQLGAFGGKVLGAGKGGHFLFIIRPIEREYFIKRMEFLGIKHIPFEVDFRGLEVTCVV